MSDPSRHPTDAMQDAIDGRLDAEARAAFDAHVAACERCRRELDALRWTKTHIGQAGRAVDVPSDLDARVRQTLDGEDARSTQGAGALHLRPRRRVAYWLAASAAAAATIAILLWVGRGGVPTAPAAAADHLRAFQAGELSLEIESDDPRVLEGHLRSTSAPATLVYDFGMMGYTLVGVRTHQIGEWPSALAAYRGAQGQALLCEMYVGRLDSLPPPAERRTRQGVDLFVYREAEVTIVFWQEGNVVCVLTGTGDPEAIVALAFAKAIKS